MYCEQELGRAEFNICLFLTERYRAGILMPVYIALAVH